MSELRNHGTVRWDFDKGFRLAGLSSPFPRAITFGDVDAEIEIRGNYLIIEGKLPHQTVTGGQAITMDARLRDGRVGIVVFGNPPHDVTAIQLWNRPGGGQAWPAALRDVHRFVKCWADWAEQHPRTNSQVSSFWAQLEREATERANGQLTRVAVPQGAPRGTAS